ncbi:hypothetical protein AB0B85_21300 [Micromonospora sp. NPDC049044]|uniref:hypothetical protein n=1 Tax=Micromonospora sp. NPDC049044 TaxID=3154827 RepID=UPI0033BFED6A
MSDGYIRLVPTDPHWQPTPGAATATTAYVTRLFSGPGDDVEQVEYEFYAHVRLIDAGENFTRVTCPRCASDIDVTWLFDLIDENGGRFDELDVTVPCCGTTVSLDALHYDWPIAFARFEVSAMNPTRAKYELDVQELAEVSAVLGHPVAQVLAHY